MMEHEPYIRLSIFAGLLAFFALLEIWLPNRKVNLKKSMRWGRNLGMSILGAVMIKILLPVTLIQVALYAETMQIGLLHILPIPSFLSILIAMIVLDLAIYVQHILFHHIPFLWRFHKVHHIDHELDVSTGVRFHPIEFFISALYKIAIIILLGPSAFAVFLFEILLNATALFSHSNLRLPLALDRLLRFAIVTPNMHLVHHSTKPQEFNRNFGFNLSWWDRLFKTYKHEAEGGIKGMSLGLEVYQNPDKTGLIPLLILPFKNRRQ